MVIINCSFEDKPGQWNSVTFTVENTRPTKWSVRVYVNGVLSPATSLKIRIIMQE